MKLQYDEITGETDLGRFFRFENEEVFLADSVTSVDEQEKTVDVSTWIATANGLETYSID